MTPKQKLSLMQTAVPFMFFIVGGWWGLSQLVENKNRIRNATRGLDMVEELDPLEEMRRKYGLENGGKPVVRRRREEPKMSSLEEELEQMNKKVDYRNWDYQPVPRPADEE
ncbi:hypothetical protein HYH03_002821 [Edaphochlamys debaryana]|uniref:Uncharacterized protein n=1 Tax=Edaphochlamys debaryana TaxID=47281 RepID=A0A836C4Z9_9CHLO|nr:hypothetical protein HYH03_002821 [Edaphochlamys debaryana]|eukprot:KAG2499242.1 hypothetical protein HYH03_002821 [Edaphochlamys debaryana]